MNNWCVCAVRYTSLLHTRSAKVRSWSTRGVHRRCTACASGALLCGKITGYRNFRHSNVLLVRKSASVSRRCDEKLRTAVKVGTEMCHGNRYARESSHTTKFRTRQIRMGLRPAPSDERSRLSWAIQMMNDNRRLEYEPRACWSMFALPVSMRFSAYVQQAKCSILVLAGTLYRRY